MKLYVLDTSVVGFAQQRHPIYESNLQNLPGGTPVVTIIITVGEDLSGWLPACRRARNGAKRVKGVPSARQRGSKFLSVSNLSPLHCSLGARLLDVSPFWDRSEPRSNSRPDQTSDSSGEA